MITLVHSALSGMTTIMAGIISAIGGQQEEAAAGAEIVDHHRGGQRIDGFGGQKQSAEHDELGDRHRRDDRAEAAGEYHGREKVQYGFGQQDRDAAGHAGVKAAVDPGAAGAEQYDGRDQQ